MSEDNTDNTQEPATAAPQPITAFTDASGNFTRTDWTDNEALRGKFSSIQALAKSYESLEKMIGKKGLIVPDEYAGKEEVDAFYTKLGRPEKMEGYEGQKPADWPQDLAWDEGRLNAFRQAAFDAGLTKKQFAALLGWANKYELEQYAGAAERAKVQTEEAQKQAMEALRADPRFGGERLQQTMSRAMAAVRKFGGEELANDPAFGNDPRVIKLFAAIGEQIGEDALGSNAENDGGSVKARIDRIMGDKSAPYWDSKHPQHEAQVREIESLFKRAFPD